MKFESQEQRNELAHKIIEERNKGNRSEAKRILEEGKEKNIQEASELVKKMRNSLSPELKKRLEEFQNFEDDTEEIKESFDIIDISNQLSTEEKIWIEACVVSDFIIAVLEENFDINTREYKNKEEVEKLKFELNYLDEIRELLNFNWHKDHSYAYPFIEEGRLIFDKITDGASEDNHNLTHVVSARATSSPKYRMNNYSICSEIKLSGIGTLYFAAGGTNPYLYNIGKPLVILSPEDSFAKNFISSCSFKQYPHHQNCNLFLNGSPINGDRNDDIMIVPDREKVVFKEQGQFLLKIRWIDIATIIVDLREGKIYKRKLSI